MSNESSSKSLLNLLLKIPTYNLSKFILAILLAVVLIVFSGISIYASHVQPVFDQKGLIEFSFATGYPGIERGITSNLIVGIVNFFIPSDPLTSNVFIRILASSLYLFSGSLLAWTVTKRYYLGIGWFVYYLFY